VQHQLFFCRGGVARNVTNIKGHLWKFILAGKRIFLIGGLRQAKATLASIKADLPSLPECKNLHLAAQKQLLENM